MIGDQMPWAPVCTVQVLLGLYPLQSGFGLRKWKFFLSFFNRFGPTGSPHCPLPADVSLTERAKPQVLSRTTVTRKQTFFPQGK